MDESLMARPFRAVIPLTAIVAVMCLVLFVAGCELFEPREPEPPSQASDSFIPPTDPDVVIQNLQNAIAQKSSVNYVRCFADPVRASRPFVFSPSPDAGARYSGIFADWSVEEERTYFQNMVARAAGRPNAFSNLLLTQRSVTLTGDSAIQSYDYTLTFEHTDPSFSTAASGNLQFVLGLDNSNAWVIYRWSDFKTTSDVTWSHFKGKFSN